MIGAQQASLKAEESNAINRQLMPIEKGLIFEKYLVQIKQLLLRQQEQQKQPKKDYSTYKETQLRKRKV